MVLRCQWFLYFIKLEWYWPLSDEFHCIQMLLRNFFLLFPYAPLMSTSLRKNFLLVRKVNISAYVVHKNLCNLFIHHCAYVKILHKWEFGLTLSRRRSLSYRNKSIDLQSKSMDWFLYDGDLRHERAKKHIVVIVHLTQSFTTWFPQKRLYILT